MPTFIIFTCHYRINGTKICNSIPSLGKLNSEFIHQETFCCGSKVFFINDGFEIKNDTQRNQLPHRVNDLINTEKVYIVRHKTGNELQDKVIKKLNVQERFMVDFSHSEGIYQDLNAWYNAEISLPTILERHFYTGFRNARNRLIEAFNVGKIPDSYYVENSQLTNTLKELYDQLVEKVNDLTISEIETFQKSLEILDL
ncbi:hypothetical protein EGI22_16000 [Lacihabitans sp. LS3-19]|uniref:hypothetical protein n=1 Tax=Lacihabitans sp. LS3-19 TaxID=2487335 RepID=UPI0020CC7D3B|nr:hypothetical protein [Lacihabitans sp. LS3-19]MCP9769406.1 hypothetical protein [Lacihabitans sp. LS3-19]